MNSQRNKKLVSLPKHALDLKSMRETSAAVNALLNIKVASGSTSKVHISSSNTVLEIARPGFPWMYPTHTEGDPSQFYQAGFCMYVSALNPLVTTGMVDSISGDNIKSCQGLWLAMQDIPAEDTGAWNVPAFPYTITPAIPAGTPLKGDLDNPDLFWYYLGDI